MNYTELSNKIIDSVKKNADGFLKLDGHAYEDVDDFIGDSNISKFISLGNVHKAKILRTIFRMFGMAFNGGTVRIENTKAQLKKTASQIAPFTKYFSMRYIDSFIKKANSKPEVNPSDQFSITKFVNRLTSEGKLADTFLELVTDGQYENVIKKEGSSEQKQSVKGDITDKEAALKEEVQRLRKQLEHRQISKGSDELFLERIADSIKKVSPSLKFTNEKWRGDKTFNHGETATEVLHISDWHIGESDNISGFNQFNYDIACERVKTLTNKVISWTKMHRSMYKVDELVIIATGDMISGDIHDELRCTNEFPAPEQCVKAAMLISKMTNELSSVFRKVRVEYIVADNHSRTTKKIEFAPGTNSYNYIVGMMSKLALKDNENVEFNVYPEIQHIIKVEKLKYLITHGNSIRGGFAGIPYYGMNRKLGAEALARMNMPDDTHFNKIVMGHYHTPLLNTGVEMTGCLSSTTAFDHSAGRHCPACQTAWLVSKQFEMDYSTFWLS